MKLPPELSFLEAVLVNPIDSYRTATWLISEFDDTTWLVNFDYEEPKQFRWDITLDDGSLLTSSKNKKLLESLKYYLTASTRDEQFGQSNAVDGQQVKRFMNACNIIDYLLIESARFQIAKHGLGGLTGGNLIEILQKIASHPSTYESIYDWTNKLAKFCYELFSRTDKGEILKLLNLMPQLSIITNEQKDDDTLGIPLELIPSIRACFCISQLYYKGRNGNQHNTVALSKIIYGNCVWGNSASKPIHSILCYNDNSSLFSREYPRASVRTGNRERLGKSGFNGFRYAIYSLGFLHEIGVDAPSVDALLEAERFAPELPSGGRFRTLPSGVVFASIRNAIEFHLDHGQLLTKALCRIALECKKRKISPAALTSTEIVALVGPKLSKFGISRLSLSVKNGLEENPYQLKGSKNTYFNELRNNSGLYELIAVYLGGVQLVIGVLMARRASELHTLNAATCLDETETWLLFLNAKSSRHLFGLRKREARPIEPIAASMIKSLIRMQKVLKRIGYIDNYQSLFSSPHFRGAAKLTEVNSASYNRNLDMFCDYFETPVNSNGERIYIRQHQLRRFFAMLFFYCSSFTKLDTLQWMLGHTDPTHVWHYITESTDKSILNEAKAHFVSEQICSGDYSNYIELAELVKDRYGTGNFGLIDSDDLEVYLQELMTEGWLEIEPEFFSDHQGKQYKIVAKLIRSKGAE